jgi:hypothetical protein
MLGALYDHQIVIPEGFWPESRSISSLDPGQKHAGVTG